MNPHPRDIHATTTAVLAQARARAAAPSACVCPEETDSWFDRSICPDPCGSMHNICVECSLPQGGCAVDARKGSTDNALYALLDLVVAAHEPTVDDENITWCDECFDENLPSEHWTWPCRFYTAAQKAVDFIEGDLAEPTYEMAFGDHEWDDDYDDRPAEHEPAGAPA